jgi:hypothetical protein
MLSARRVARSLALVTALSLAIPALAIAAYGAIAVDPHTGAWGLSYSAPAKWYAERQAVRKCAGECNVMVWVRNRCAAVVRSHTTYVAGIGATKKAAIKKARKRAHDRRAPMVAWVCSG